jgi:hypothetical protein
MTDQDGDARRRRSARLRAGLVAAAVATALLAASGGGSPAGASAARHGAAALRGYLYWSNATSPTSGTIGRARLNGTDVNQKFITGASDPRGVAVHLSR